MRWPVSTATLCAALIIVPGWHCGIAHGDSAIPLGGGAGILINGTACTLGAIGHDNTGQLVGFTAGHCGAPGSPVVAQGDPVGTVATVNGDLDYAVIKFDPAKLAPTANFAGFAINGIGPDPATFRQPICTQGGATGFGCGAFKAANLKPGIAAANVPAWQPGDDGAPVTVDSQLVGITRKGDTTPILGPVPELSTHISFTLLSAILSDVNSKSGPGAGFSPVPA